VTDGTSSPPETPPADTPRAGTPPPEAPPPKTPSPSPEAPAGQTDGAGSPEDMTVGQLVFEISDRATVLVREEIELAKTEVTEKLNQLLRGGVVGIAAGVFLLAALAMIMHGIAWLLNDLFFDNFYAGFFIEALIFLLIAAGAGLFAYRAFQKAFPPMPDMAIEEAKAIKADFDHEEGN
jgi:hypothetical protein